MMALKEIFNPILTLHSGLVWKPGDAKEERARSMTNKEILKRLEEIEARAEKATPGPWEAKSGYAESDNGCTLIGAGKPIAYFYKRISPGGTFLHRRDCEFAVSAREDVSWLCKTVRQLVAQLEEVEAQCAAMREALKEISRTEQDEKLDGTILGYLVHDAYEMCGIADVALRHEAGLELRDRLRRLEAVAKAAREIAECEPYHRDYALSGNSDPRVCYYCGAPWEHKAPQHKPECPLEKLRRALTALEEVEG